MSRSAPGEDRLLRETIAAWRANQRMHAFLIRHIPDAHLRDTLSKRGGRNVVQQFTHVHNVRWYQLSKRAKPLATGLRVFGAKEEPSKKVLLGALEDSTSRVEQWFERALAGEKGFRLAKTGLVPTAGFLIAHESHHRGIVLLTLKQCGCSLGISVTYGVWGEWNR